MAVRRTALFSGRVQGVGFRFAACRIARRFDVTGFVRNLPDGRVELVAEGEPRQVESFIQAVRDEMAAYVQALELSSSPATHEFSDFGISYV